MAIFFITAIILVLVMVIDVILNAREIESDNDDF
ncbi:MAG: hypothetical protein JWQ28_1736 [Pedobacter sp.]|jgi:hypothetical protein|nr:hypothetical protein [Pedobacter sp.]